MMVQGLDQPKELCISGSLSGTFAWAAGYHWRVDLPS
jgi:hypothetical protein